MKKIAILFSLVSLLATVTFASNDKKCEKKSCDKKSCCKKTAEAKSEPVKPLEVTQTKSVVAP